MSPPETRLKPKLPDIFGDGVLEQQPAFPTRIITPPGSYIGHELNTNMGVFGLGNMIAQGTFNEVYRLTNRTSKKLVARACRVPIATDHLSQLLGAIPPEFEPIATRRLAVEFSRHYFSRVDKSKESTHRNNPLLT